MKLNDLKHLIHLIYFNLCFDLSIVYSILFVPSLFIFYSYNVYKRKEINTNLSFRVRLKLIIMNYNF